MNGHAVLAPSSAARRVACPGSRALEAKYPGEPSNSSREGDLAHWLASELLKGEPSEDIALTRDLTPEMWQGANLYSENVLGVCEQRGLPRDVLQIEKPLSVANIHKDCWGTPDCWLFVPGAIYIWDYKFGHGQVEVFENWQLIEYAAGIINHLQINGLTDQHTLVHFRIVQPRGAHREGPVREWRIYASDLRPYFNTLEHAEREAMSPDARCRPSPECNYCSGRRACEALQKSSLTAVETSSSNAPLDLSPTELGNDLRYLKNAAELLDARITGLSEQALSVIKNGERVPFFAVEEANARERWTKTPEEVAMLGEMVGVDLTKPLETITPKQALKLGVPADLIRAYSETPRGALKLVASDSTRLKKIFTNSY